MGEIVRLQKYIAMSGAASRRAAEAMIADGRVKVNGQTIAEQGVKVEIGADKVTVDGKELKIKDKKYYIMLNKPTGYVSTAKDQFDRPTVIDLVGSEIGTRIFPVGRLDYDTEGLLLLTNDGDFANKIMHPSGHIAKTYRVTVRPDITEEQLTKLTSGVVIDGVKTLPASATILTKEEGRVVLQLTIREGRNRQIRKMCEAVGLEVARLKRISIGPLKLGMLKPGEYRMLTPQELTAIRNSIRKEVDKNASNNKKRRH